MHAAYYLVLVVEKFVKYNTRTIAKHLDISGHIIIFYLHFNRFIIISLPIIRLIFSNNILNLQFTFNMHQPKIVSFLRKCFIFSIINSYHERNSSKIASKIEQSNLVLMINYFSNLHHDDHKHQKLLRREIYHVFEKPFESLFYSRIR